MNYDDLQKTIAAYKDQLAKGVLNKSFDGTLGVGASLNQYNLLPTALTIYPVLTPLRNILPRLQGKGANHEVKSIVGATDSGLTNVFGNEGNSGPQIALQTVDVTNSYQTLKLAGSTSFEAQFVDQGFIDAKATTVVNTLRRLMINEEKAILFGGNSTANLTGGFAGGSVGACAAPTLSALPNPTGSGLTGFSSTGTLYVKITAVTGMGESLPSTEVSQAWTAGQVIQVNFPARGAFPVQAYKVYTATTSGSEKLQTTQMVYVSGLQAVTQSSGASVLIGAAGSGANVPSTDHSAAGNAYNGLFAQLYGSAAAVSGTQANWGFGPVIESANAQLTYTLVDNLFETMWNQSNADPDWVLCHATEARAITGSTIGAGTPYFLAPNGDQPGLTGGYRVARLTNGTTGKEVVVKSHPYFNQGILVAGSDSVPDWYTGSEMPAPIALNMLVDYTEVDYPPTYNTSGSGDQWVNEIWNMGTFELYAPVLFGVLDSIASGIASGQD